MNKIIHLVKTIKRVSADELYDALVSLGKDDVEHLIGLRYMINAAMSYCQNQGGNDVK